MVYRRWLKIGTGVGAGITTILGFFALLSSLYGFEIVDLTGNFKCEGTYENPCISTTKFRLAGIKLDSKDTVKWTFGANEGELDPILGGIKTINYINDNMTVEFVGKEGIIGQATLKSHKEYDERKRVATGKNRTVIWYEFSGFNDVQKDALMGVEFIDLRKKIFNYSGEEPLEQSEIEKYMIHNPNYLLPIEKDYTFVYLNERGDWIDYNSADIPKENIMIGVKADLAWGELLDVALSVFGNNLTRHALVIGTSSGFVSSAPSADPEGSDIYVYGGDALATHDTSPATAVTVTEIGWYNSEDVSVGFDVGIYDDDGEPNNLIDSSTGHSDSGIGWMVASGLSISISGNTSYWIAIANDDGKIDKHSSDGTGLEIDFFESVLPPSGTWSSSSSDVDGMFAIYAVWEAASDDEYPIFSSYWDDNATLVDSGTAKFNVTLLSTNGTVFLEINGSNYTAFNETASVYNVSVSLGSAGAYDYYWGAWGNGSSTNYNVSVTRSYTVNASADTCTCPADGTNWAVTCSDNCVISADCDMAGGNVTLTGTGTFKLNSGVQIYNWTYRRGDLQCHILGSGNAGFTKVL